jgi:hypothetical protein
MIHDAMEKNMVEKKGIFHRKERFQYDPLSALVAVNDYLYAMTMKTLGSPDIPESFGENVQELIKELADKAEFEIKENEYNKTSIDRCYEKQRRQDAKSVKKATLENKKQILSKTASPLRVAQYAGEYFALKKRQEGHGNVWKFFHKKENEARMTLLAEMEKILKTVLKDQGELDKLNPIDIAKIVNKQNLSIKANETFQSGIDNRNKIPSNFFKHSPVASERENMERTDPNKDDIELEENLRMHVEFDKDVFMESEPAEMTYAPKVEDKVANGPTVHDSGEEVDLPNLKEEKNPLSKF